jgi:hypothetical protein
VAGAPTTRRCSLRRLRLLLRTTRLSLAVRPHVGKGKQGQEVTGTYALGAAACGIQRHRAATGASPNRQTSLCVTTLPRVSPPWPGGSHQGVWVPLSPYPHRPAIHKKPICGSHDSFRSAMILRRTASAMCITPSISRIRMLASIIVIALSEGVSATEFFLSSRPLEIVFRVAVARRTVDFASSFRFPLLCDLELETFRFRTALRKEPDFAVWESPCWTASSTRFCIT